VMEIIFLSSSDISASLAQRCDPSLVICPGVLTPATTSSPLSIHQVFTIENILAGCSIPGKSYSCAGIFTHIAKYHCLNINCSTPITGDLVYFPVINCPFGVPTVKYSHHCSPELFPRIDRKIFPYILFNGFFKFCHQLFKVIYC